MPALPQPISHTVDAIYAGLAAGARNGDSLGIPMSQAADECERKLWYRLRWACPTEAPDGVKQRRFAAGREQEGRILQDLATAGVSVETIDAGTGRQFFVSLSQGWLRGKIKGRARSVPGAEKTVHVVECKSMKAAKFKELVKKKLKDAQPEHYASCQLYMHADAAERCLYLAACKDSDELYAERLEYDFEYSARLEARSSRIVATDKAPPRLHDDPNAKAAFVCDWCPAKLQCHNGAFARRNCRTCLSADLRPGAEVWCTLAGVRRTYDEQQSGCEDHLYLPDLVPGDQEDASERERLVAYRLPSGEVWIDGQGRAA